MVAADELQRTLAGLEGSPLLLAQLLYGTRHAGDGGLAAAREGRGFYCGAIVVREAKGGKDRVVMLP